MKPSPAFQFYPQDFLVGTADLTAEEVGGYIRLLCYQWAKGSIPNDVTKLMQMSGISSSNSLANVQLKFRLCDDGTLRNDRMELVRKYQEDYRLKRSECGKKGGNPQFQKGKHNPYYNLQDKLEDKLGDKLKINPSSSSSSSNKKIGAFEKPSPSQVSEYGESIGFKVDGEYFCSYYEARGWKLGKGVSMKSWQSTVVTWKKNDQKRAQDSRPAPIIRKSFSLPS